MWAHITKFNLNSRMNDGPQKLNFSLSLQHNRATLLPQHLQLVFLLFVNIFPAADADQIFPNIFNVFFQPLMQINEIDVSPGFESQVI